MKKAQTHRKVERKHADVVRQQHEHSLLCIAPRAAVAVAVHYNRQRLVPLRHLRRLEVAALQSLARRILLRETEAKSACELSGYDQPYGRGCTSATGPPQWSAPNRALVCAQQSYGLRPEEAVQHREGGIWLAEGSCTPAAGQP